ncbi:MAG TPA: hypothetical protein VJT67_12745 [Longimicrobiaceae bacterium]|nr:hypothetical protein [Longimicrobiaceae bacterium]
MSTDARTVAAERALADHGVYGATVEVEGHEHDVAVIRVSSGDWERMMSPAALAITDAVKAAGFRYVTLDLADGDGG